MMEDSRSSWRELNTAVVLLRIVEIRGLESAFWIWVSGERRVVRPILSIACMLLLVSMSSNQRRNDKPSLRQYSSYLEQIHQLWIRGNLHWWEVTRAVGILCLRKFYGLQNRSPTARWKKRSWVRRLYPKMILFTIREETKSGRLTEKSVSATSKASASTPPMVWTFFRSSKIDALHSSSSSRIANGGGALGLHFLHRLAICWLVSSNPWRDQDNKSEVTQGDIQSWLPSLQIDLVSVNNTEHVRSMVEEINFWRHEHFGNREVLDWYSDMMDHE